MSDLSNQLTDIRKAQTASCACVTLDVTDNCHCSRALQVVDGTAYDSKFFGDAGLAAADVECGKLCILFHIVVRAMLCLLLQVLYTD